MPASAPRGGPPPRSSAVVVPLGRPAVTSRPGVRPSISLAVSGYGGLEDRRKSRETGFDRHLVKPIGRATLEELIKSAAGP